MGPTPEWVLTLVQMWVRGGRCPLTHGSREDSLTCVKSVSHFSHSVVTWGLPTSDNKQGGWAIHSVRLRINHVWSLTITIRTQLILYTLVGSRHSLLIYWGWNHFSPSRRASLPSLTALYSVWAVCQCLWDQWDPLGSTGTTWSLVGYNSSPSNM